jgi:hypothetical protein
MRFDGFDADAKIFGDDLVGLPADRTFQRFALAAGKRCDAVADRRSSRC